MIDHEYIALKLVNGDNLIALMVDEDDNRFVIMYPIQMKSVRVSVDGPGKEVLAGVPWCSFTDHEVFQIWKNDVIMIKPLNESTIEYYKRLVDITETDYESEFDDEEDDNFFIDPTPTIH